MKKFVLEFARRGLVACGFGPLALAVLYLILERTGTVQVLSVNQVCAGIFSLAVLAFIAGGMNAIYQIERLPLMAAVTIHGGVLYGGYLGTYLVNDWLEWGAAPSVVFSGIFLVGYLGIWSVIYAIVKKNTKKINEMLLKKQREVE